MNFINSPVDITTLPAAEEVTLQPVHSAYRKVLLIEWLITAIILMAIAAAVIIFNENVRNTMGWLFVLLAVLAVCTFYYVSIIKAFPFLAYAIREKDVLLQKGWLIRRLKISPFNRIQNCSVQNGPLERKFGLASLVVYTAGSEGADLRIPGLLHEEAEKLRHFILEQIHTGPDGSV